MNAEIFESEVEAVAVRLTELHRLKLTARTPLEIQILDGLIANCYSELDEMGVRAIKLNGATCVSTLPSEAYRRCK